jgi:hypothetical protein
LFLTTAKDSGLATEEQSNRLKKSKKELKELEKTLKIKEIGQKRQQKKDELIKSCWRKNLMKIQSLKKNFDAEIKLDAQSWKKTSLNF